MLRITAIYRTPALECLATQCTGGLHIFTGTPDPDEGVTTVDAISGATVTTTVNRQYLTGPLRTWWQVGIKDWLTRVNPDVLVVEANPRLLSTRFARRWMHQRGRPVVGWGLGTTMQGKGFEALRTFGRDRFLRAFDGMIAYSEKAAREYEAVGIPRSQIVVAHNAVARRPTRPAPERSPYFHNAAPVVLFVGRLLPRKRVETLIRACAALPASRRPALHIVGTGPSEDGLKSLAHSIYPEAKFFGELRGEALQSLWRGADLFVLPGMGGLAVQEAMSWGLPLIVAEGDGTQFDLVRSENGWHVEPGNEDQLSALLDRALADSAALRRMGRASRRIVEEEVNVEGMVDAFLSAITGAKR